MIKILLAKTQSQQIKKIIAKGGIIAYPTEAVYGLGCHPFMRSAVLRLVEIKKRSIDKGLLLICSSWDQILPLIHKPSCDLLDKVYASWPGPVTWLFPARASVPEWLTGKHSRLAIRMTNHPIASALCDILNKPIISTSANFTGTPPVRDAWGVKQLFHDKIDYIVEGQVGTLSKPTPIRDAITGCVVRE